MDSLRRFGVLPLQGELPVGTAGNLGQARLSSPGCERGAKQGAKQGAKLGAKPRAKQGAKLLCQSKRLPCSVRVSTALLRLKR